MVGDQNGNIGKNSTVADFDSDYLKWLELINKYGFPDKLVITVLVESDKDNPYKEGSHDAGLVVRGLVDWMHGE